MFTKINDTTYKYDESTDEIYESIERMLTDVEPEINQHASNAVINDVADRLLVMRVIVSRFVKFIKKLPPNKPQHIMVTLHGRTHTITTGMFDNTLLYSIE